MSNIPTPNWYVTRDEYFSLLQLVTEAVTTFREGDGSRHWHPEDLSVSVEIANNAISAVIAYYTFLRKEKTA